jgi:hypothetical protein
MGLNIMQKKNIFVVSMSSFQRSMFQQLEHADKCIFHQLLTNDVLDDRDMTEPQLLEYAKQKLTDFEGSIDGIYGYGDFPMSTMVPILNEAFGLPFTPLTSYLKCDHKYWSRLEQQASISEYIPSFAVFDAFDDASFDTLPLAYPFWIKPVRSVSSHLGFKIESRDDFEQAKPIIRKQIDAVLQPFDRFLRYVSADLPDNIRILPKHCFLAEELMGGHQCSLEASMKNNKLYVFGFVDTIHYPNSSSILSFQYPSKIPDSVQHEMARIGERFLQHIKFDNIAFHIEFFWDEARDIIRLIEVNTRMAQRHSKLFQDVEGVANHQGPLNLLLGYPPVLSPRKTEFNIAAVLFYRVDYNACVEAIPSKQDIAAIEAVLPGARVEIMVSQGERLSEIQGQDSYMYRLWGVYLGAEDEKALNEKYQTCIKLMNEKLKLKPCD